MSASSIPAPALSADPDFQRLKDHIIGATGMAYYVDKDDQLAGHLTKRLAALGCQDCASYLRVLQSNQMDDSELDSLIAMLTIGETFFFRHHEAFDSLRKVVFPDLIRRNQNIRRLRIWSAGCSIGAEPYSIAILLKRDLQHLLDGWQVNIIATDINREVLNRAREGRFEEWAFRSVPDEIKSACFTKSGNSWVIDPQYKEWITFQYHNLVKDPCPSLRNHLDCFDLIVCRNVTIYFDKATIENLVRELHCSLPEGGWLLVGHAEPNIEVYRSFHTVNSDGAVLYQKNSAEPAASGWSPLPPPAPPAWQFPPQTPLPGVPPRPPAILIPKHSPAPARPPARADTGVPLPELASIRQLADGGDLEKAAERCEQLIQREKLNPVAHFYYALVLEQMGRRGETQDSLRRAVYLDRTFIIAHYYLGLIQQRLEQPKQALRCFRNVLDLLSGLRDDQPIPAAEEFTVSELKQLTRMHIEALPA